MRSGTRLALTLLGCAALAAVAGAAGLCIGYRKGSARSFLRDRALAESPEPASGGPAEWTDGEGPPPAEAGAPEPAPEAAPEAPETEPVETEPVETPAATARAPFAIDLARPVRISWPLEVGPDWCRDRPDDRVCLRSREGANELQTPGTGRALYAFRLARAGRYRVWVRARWTSDGVGSLDCNNSWFAGFDALPAAVVGNRDMRNRWAWKPGPAAELSAGAHWLRMELREDGPCADRAVIVPAESATDEAALDAVEALGVEELTGFAGLRPPLGPQSPLGEAELWAHPTGSLVIGTGHVNEITLGAWLLGGRGDFRGRVGVRCTTARPVTVSGDPEVALTAAKPFARKVLRLEFPASAPRREHKVIVEVTRRDGEVVFRQEVRFVKPFAWGFLGPFADSSGGSRGLYRGTGNIRRLKHPCDRDPALLAKMRSLEELGLSEVPLAGSRAPGKAEWKVVADGSCCEWTGAVDLQRVYGTVGSAFAYAVTWVNAQTSLHHRSFSFQADDSGWLWMNGDFIAALPVDLPREANRLWSSGSLRPGPNPVVVKLTQNRRYWGFRLEVVDWHWQGRRGDVITGVEAGRWPKE